VLDAVQRMHELGITHLDLNCGNVLVSPDLSRVALIDFEYAPVHGLSFHDQQRFDLLRLAHNLLKPRRGRDAAFSDPGAFVASFARSIPSPDGSSTVNLDPAGFHRVFDHAAIGRQLSDLLGVEAPVISG
jgi:serine/threonine protein kinase